MDPPDISKLRARYRTYEDGELVSLALTGASDLTPVARDVLKSELAMRQLVPELHSTLDIRVERMSAKQLDAVVRRIQFMPCPMCGKTTTSLNGFVSKGPPLWASLLMSSAGAHVILPSTFYIGCLPCLSQKGARKLFGLKPGQRWKPGEALINWVFRHVALFDHFESNTEAIAALLRFDYTGFLQAIRARQ